MVTKKKKIAFILDHNLKEYRIPFFNGLENRNLSIDVIHSGQPLKNCSFTQIIVENKKVFSFEYKCLPGLKGYDVVICMQNIRMLNLWLLSLNPFRRYKLFHWGIGASSATGLKLKKTLVSRFRDFLTIFSDAIILYSNFPKPLFSNRNLRKLFVAHNTIDNPIKEDMSGYQKDSFIFIGTLNKRKGLEVLISAFKDYLKNQSVKSIKKLFLNQES